MRSSTAQYAAAVDSLDTSTAREVLFRWSSFLDPLLNRTNECLTPSALYGVGCWDTDGLGTVLTTAAPPAVLPSGRTVAFKVVWAAGAAGDVSTRMFDLDTVIGTVYTLSMRLWNVNSPAVRLGAIGATSGTSTYGVPSAGTGAYQTLSVQFTATDELSHIILTNNATTAAGKIVWYGDILLERGAGIGVYFDGDSPNCNWAGPFLGGSASVQQLAPYFDLTRAVKSYTGQAALTTDMPEGARLIEGYPARSGTLILSGMLAETSNETQNARWLFDSSSTTSPLYNTDWTGTAGVEVTIRQGLMLPTFAAPEMFEVITAWVDDFTVDRATGDVTLSLIDGRWKLSDTPALPAAINFLAWAPGQTPNPIMAPGLTALWPMDYMLRSAGIYTSPPPRPNCLGYVSLHGSMWPEVAGPMTLANTQLYGTWPNSGASQPLQPDWQPGRYVGQVPVAGTALFPMRNGIYQFGGQVLTLEMWVTTGVLSQNATEQVMVGDQTMTQSVIGLTVSSNFGQIVCASTTQRLGHVAVPYTHGGGTVGVTSPALDDGWHQVTAAYLFPDSVSGTVTYFLDRVPLGTEAVSGLADSALAFMTHMNVIVNDAGTGVAVDTVQASADPAQLPTPELVPGAVLQASLNNLTAIPNVAPKSDEWAVLQAMFDAETGVGGFDEPGQFYFRNRDNVYTATSQRTIATNVKQLQVRRQEATRARKVTANVYPLRVGPAQVVWAATEIYGILPGHTLRFIATLPTPTVFVPLSMTVVPGGGLTSFTSNGWRASYAPDGSGSRPGNLRFTITQLSSTAVKVEIFNPNNAPVWMVSAIGDCAPVYVGTPAINIVGNPIAPAPSADTGGTGSTGAVVVQSTWGSGIPNLALPDSLWRQDTVSTQLLTDDLLGDLYQPRELVPTLTFVGDSRLQLGDRVTLSDPGEYVSSGFGPNAPLNDDVVLTTINPSIDSSGGFVQTCVARYAARPGAWVLGVPGRSELGVTTPI